MRELFKESQGGGFGNIPAAPLAFKESMTQVEPGCTGIIDFRFLLERKPGEMDRFFVADLSPNGLGYQFLIVLIYFEIIWIGSYHGLHLLEGQLLGLWFDPFSGLRDSTFEVS